MLGFCLLDFCFVLFFVYFSDSPKEESWCWDLYKWRYRVFSPLLCELPNEQLTFFKVHTPYPKFPNIWPWNKVATNTFIRVNSVQSHYTSKLGPESGNQTLLLFNPDGVSPNGSWFPPAKLANCKLYVDYFSLIQTVLESSAQYEINNNSLNSCKLSWILYLNFWNMREIGSGGEVCKQKQTLIAW